MLLLKLLFKNIYLFFINARQREFYWLLLVYGSVPRYRKKNIRFLSYTFEVPDCASFLWQFKEIFADDIYKFSCAHKDPLIYDCGANVGTSCLYFKKLFPESRIIAFEADPSMAATLEKNMQSNNIHNVEIVSKAVWIHNDGVTMQLDGSDGGAIKVGGATLIPSIRLKDLLQMAEKIEFLKMDIEGAENEVIEDCKDLLYKANNIFIEYHSHFNEKQNLGQILQYLTNNGLRYYVLPVNLRRSPFVNVGTHATMDFQANIFAYK